MKKKIILIMKFDKKLAKKMKKKSGKLLSSAFFSCFFEFLKNQNHRNWNWKSGTGR